VLREVELAAAPERTVISFRYEGVKEGSPFGGWFSGRVYVDSTGAERAALPWTVEIDLACLRDPRR
jgi:hypothetical protein